MTPLVDTFTQRVTGWFQDQTGIGVDQPEFLYVLLVLPVVLALTVVLQGLVKMVRHDDGGCLVFVLGILFFGMVVGVYVFSFK